MKKCNVNKSLSLVLGAACLLCVGQASAENGGYFYDHAKVTNVQPLFETVFKTVPVEECWNEKVPVRYGAHKGHRYRDRHSSATPTLIGALIGGALGNELGHKKRNKQIGVAVGGILGASIGHDIGRQRQRDHTDRHTEANYYGDGHHASHEARYEVVKRCSVQNERYEEQALVGYEVSYRYRGNTYTTVTDSDPGDKLRVRVDVSPVAY